jgi:hypothetical protein
MAERIVVVPWAPRPLVVPGDGERRPRPGGFDEFVDELLEPDEKPGWSDVALMAGGTGLFLGGLAGGASPAVVFTGAMAAMLGCSQPLRLAWRTRRHRRARRRQDAAPVLGLPLVATHPATEALIAGYQRVLDLRGLPGVEVLADEAAVAAHLTMIEVATLLNGEPPVAATEEAYVWQRAGAVESLSLTLEREYQGWLATGELVEHLEPGR